jgi:hypothetical protein
MTTIPTPSTIKEDGARWTVENARPLFMRMSIAVITPIVLGLVGWTMYQDALDHHWVMFGVRSLFVLVILMGARFSLFGSESVAIEGGELVYRRGLHVERCGVADVEKLQRQGNHLRVVVRGREHAIVVGAGLRQPPAAIQWLAERLQDAIFAARGVATAARTDR